MAIKRNYDIPNLIRELAENRISPHEILREALSNAKDHGAEHVWIKTSKDNRNEVSLLLIDDGEGMNNDRLEAFWGVGASKKDIQSIGYKGHGTKLYFDCRRVSVATRHGTDHEWRLFSLELPLESSADTLEEVPLSPTHRLRVELDEIGLSAGYGTAIWLENLGCEDKAELLDRHKIESFCDWFTVIGDIRSGLFSSRIEFHRAIDSDDEVLASLRRQDAGLRPIDVRLCINGERGYASMGQGRGAKCRSFLAPWKDDCDEFHDKPGLLMFGHRFADVHEPRYGSGTRVRDDMSSLCLTTPETWTTSEGISIVARVEGHRRQRNTYLEASWHGKPGLYNFQKRFGLWLCRDFIPVTQRNDLLRRALEVANKNRKLRFELSSLRNWQVFVNDQLFKPTANRNDIANHAAREQKITEALVDLLKVALAQKPFRDWVERLQEAALERNRNREMKQISDRLDAVKEWLSKGDDGIDLSDVQGLPRLDPDYSLRLRVPRSEQELFYVYGLLSGRHEMPIHIIDYDASEGVDAIATLRVPELIPTAKAQVRVELKQEVRAGFPIHHFFDAIDVILCWKVQKVGEIYEETSATHGKLQKRRNSVLTPAMDTHEIVYESGDGLRTIPVLQLSTLFDTAMTTKRGGR